MLADEVLAEDGASIHQSCAGPLKSIQQQDKEDNSCSSPVIHAQTISAAEITEVLLNPEQQPSASVNADPAGLENVAVGIEGGGEMIMHSRKDHSLPRDVSQVRKVKTISVSA